MDVEFDDANLNRLETDALFCAVYPKEVVRSYRQRMQQIRAALTELDLQAMKSLRMEKLAGETSHTIGLSSRWKLNLRFEGKQPFKAIKIIGIIEYQKNLEKA